MGLGLIKVGGFEWANEFGFTLPSLMWIEIILNIDIHLSYSLSLESYLAMKRITKKLEEIDGENNYRIKNYIFWKYNMARKFAIFKLIIYGVLSIMIAMYY